MREQQTGPNRLLGRPVDIVTVTTYIEGEKIAETVTRQQQRRARTNAIQRRGPHEGATPMDDDTRQKIQAAFEALQADNPGTALDILWRLLGYDSDEPAA